MVLTKEERLNANWENMVKWWGLPNPDGTHVPPTQSNFSKEDEEWLLTSRNQRRVIFDPVERVYEISSFLLHKEDEDEDEEDDYDDDYDDKSCRENYMTSALLEGLLDELQGYVKSIDVAEELKSADALVALLYNVMYSKHAAVRAKAAEAVSTIVRDNPNSRQLVMEAAGLKPLLYNFTSDSDLTARTKALAAISSLIRNNKPGISEFRLGNGYEALWDALTSESVMFQREALNLIQYLLHENSSDCNIVTELGLPCIMMHLSSSDDAEVREAALSCLLVLASDEGGNSGQLVKDEDNLKQVLQKPIEGISAMAAPEDLGAATEECQLVDSLWNACYSEPSSLQKKGLLVLPGEDAPAPDVASKLCEPPTRAWAAAEATNRNSVSGTLPDSSIGKKRRSDDDELVLPIKGGDWIKKILVWLPVVSLLRFKSVCKSWCDVIQSSSFIDLHTANTFNSSSSDKFGSFILLGLVEKRSPTSRSKIRREYALLMLSSSSSESVSVSRSGGWWWSTDSNYIPHWEIQEDDQEPDDYDDQVFKVDNSYNYNNLGGGGGGGGGGLSNDDDQQQQQQLVFKLESLGFPSCYKLRDNYSLTKIVGSCNGIVCLHDKDEDDHNKVLSLWNPVTRQFRFLPKSIAIDIGEGCPRLLLAFGFDVETKDYKVLLVTCFSQRFYRPSTPVECLCRVQVYSLNTNSWRLLEGITCLPGFTLYDAGEGQVLYLNGSCFFTAQFFHTKHQPWFPENDRFLISFHFTKQIFTPIQLPDHHQDQDLYLTSLGDKIAIFTGAYYAKDVDNNDIWVRKRDCNYGICSQMFDIWVLNEQHGSIRVNRESWTKLHSFRIDRERPGQWILPRGISNDGEFAMIETRYSNGMGKKMKLYNLVTKEVKKFLSCSMVMSKANAYKPSLVRLQ